jgi:hypothetical protein
MAVGAQDGPDEAARVRFLGLLVEYPDAPSLSLAWIEANWRDDFVPMALEIVRFVPDRHIAQALLALVARKTGETGLGGDWAAWMRWQWARAPPPPSFAAFKAALYREIDPRFERYFSPDFPARIRLDEVVWGGVWQDGIPPLRQPKMLLARAARYLSDTDVVFGLSINADARAYPKRILAWHEMFVDRVGGVDVAGVYCTLCGARPREHRAADARGRDYHLGRVAAAAPDDPRPVARHRTRARLRRRRRLPRLLRHR